jgi:hypothetical protein
MLFVEMSSTVAGWLLLAIAVWIVMIFVAVCSAAEKKRAVRESAAQKRLLVVVEPPPPEKVLIIRRVVVARRGQLHSPGKAWMPFAISGRTSSEVQRP